MRKRKKYCKGCGEEYSNKNTVYCTKECYDTHQKCSYNKGALVVTYDNRKIITRKFQGTHMLKKILDEFQGTFPGAQVTVSFDYREL